MKNFEESADDLKKLDTMATAKEDKVKNEDDESALMEKPNGLDGKFLNNIYRVDSIYTSSRIVRCNDASN